MTREDELEFLKCDLENIITGMTICEGILSQEEKDHLSLHRRCLLVLQRIKVAESEGQGMADLISRQAAIDALHMHLMYRMGTDSNKKRLDDCINGLPSAQETHEERTETHACDCIDRQAAIDAIDAILPVEPMKNEYTQGITCGAALAIEYVKQLPSVQPEIIMCKDCKYMTEHYDTDGNVPYWCSEWDSGTDYDGFCHYAERRTDE